MTAARWRVFGIATLVAFLAMVLWSLASPLGTSPDEPSHMIRAASTVRGDAYGTPNATDPSLSDVMVPRYVAQTAAYACTAFDPSVTADCQPHDVASPDDLVVSSHSANTGSPVYYAVVGLPSLVLSGDVALYAMRLVSALLTAVMIGSIFFALRELPRSRWASLTAVVACTPMLLYLGGSVNPNGVEAAAAGAVFALLVALLRVPAQGRVLLERVGLLLLAATLVTSSRSIGLLWVVIATAAAALIADPAVVRDLVRRPLAWVAAGLCAAVCLLAVAWTITLPTVGSAVFSGAGTSPLQGFQTMLLRSFDLDGAVGLFGWVDTPSPTFTLVVYALAIGGPTIAALVLARGRARLAVILLGAALVLVPAVSQALVVSTLGYIWQGRYILAVLVCLLLMVGIALDDASDSAGPAVLRFCTVGLALIAAAQAFVFFMVLRRYVSGDSFLVAMLSRPAWQPPGGWLLLAVLYAIVMTAAVLLVRRSIAAASSRPTQPVSSR